MDSFKDAVLCRDFRTKFNNVLINLSRFQSIVIQFKFIQANLSDFKLIPTKSSQFKNVESQFKSIYVQSQLIKAYTSVLLKIPCQFKLI